MFSLNFENNIWIFVYTVAFENYITKSLVLFAEVND